MTAMPATRDLEIVSDDDYEHRLEFLNGESEPLPLAGYTFKAQIRQKGGSTVDFSIDETELAAGVVTIGLTAEQTRELRLEGRWDFQTTSPDGFRETWLRGDVRVSRDVTRNA